MTIKEGGADPAGVNTTENQEMPPSSDGNASFLRAARAGNVEKVLEYLKGSIDINTSNANGLNALHLAAKEGHVNVVIELLKHGANVNAATKKGNCALHIASLAGQEEIVKILIKNSANINIQSQNGFTPLYMAAQENHDNVVKYLLANNASQSLATEDGFTPLAVALQQGHDKVVAVLLENDAKGRVRLPALHIAAKKDDCKAAALLLQNDHDPDVTSKSGFTPLHIAAHYGNDNIGKLLLEKNADVNYSAKHQITPLHVAAKWGKSNMVTLLIDKSGKIDASTRDGLTPLHCAARSGHDKVVDLLLEKGAPITAKTKNGLAPLHMASQGDHVDSARILLYHKAPVDDVTVDYLTALHVAAHCGHVRVAKLLLDRKADPNARALNGFTPLHIACKKNRSKVVELLLKNGASIEATTESGLTPLHVASFMGCMNIVIYLIQHGANPDIPTVRGETPLHLAARANQSDIIRILLRNGAHVDASAREQQTPLHIAARLGNVDIVGLLLQHGASVDATTKDMYTALHIAAKEGQEEVASVLLDHGASLTSTTKKGFTPLHLAAKYGNIKVARLLLQKDAPVDSQGKNGVTPLHVAAHYDHVNVALLLLDKGAYPHATAKNGYTPLHIAAKKNQMDIATTLLEYGAKPNAESKAGYTPLHLASQEGHTDMTTLLIEHHADVNAAAKNGLTPLHLCAQEDRVNVAAILVKNGADIGPQTKAGYTPLHVASHFGQINIIRFFLQHGADVNAVTSHGYTPLHQAAQQGHTLIINLLLEHKASPNTTTSLGQTALSIAQRLGYVSVVETLKIVTETIVTTTTTTVIEEKYKVVAPETMQETFMSDSEDEGAEDTVLGDQSFRYLTADEMKSLGDDSLPIDVTRDERVLDSTLSAPLTAEEDHLTPQHYAQQEAFSSSLAPDNVELVRAPVHAGFLVSFMVDARGGAMRGCRHSGVRVIIPPRKAPMPMRITCRYLRKEKLAHPPPLMEGEACASRILEVGPTGAKFLGPVIIEVPHFAALRGREREITILRSDNGVSWREHSLKASDDAVHDVFNESFEGEELNALEDFNTNRITRILTTDFPQYFAIITRIRQEVHAIGSEGGMVSSTVVPQVQVIFPEGALTKKIKVGLQVHPVTPELVTKMLGNRVAVSPIVTVEPRRRKFHKPITLTIPVPQAATKGMINQYSGEAPTLRLLCSITGGTTKAQWEDVTGSTPLTFVNDCVSFTTTVSARFWMMDCRQVSEANKFATELYREAIHVPFMAKFVVFAKRHDPLEAQLRVFCMTDDKEDKTLESQEHFSEVAKSRDVEVLEAKYQYLEFAGNLVPVTKSGEQLNLTFQAFRENRLPFTIRVKDPHQEPLGRVAFMREPRVSRGDAPQTPICNLNIALPEAQLTPVSELVTLEKKYGFVEETGLANPELIHRADLRLSDIAKELRGDWVPLALQLDVPETDINSIRSECPESVNQQALVMLRHWLQRAGQKATGNSLEKALRKINREDIVNQCMFNVELVTDDVEKAVAKVHLDQSGFDAFKEELGSSRDTSLRRDFSLNGTLEERDIMKDAESAAETSSESSDKEAHFKAEAREHAAQENEDQPEPEVSEGAFMKLMMGETETTLVGQTHRKQEPKDSSESYSHDLSNGHVIESSFKEEISEPTSAISSDATAELELSSAEERTDGSKNHFEKKDSSGLTDHRKSKLTASSCISDMSHYVLANVFATTSSDKKRRNFNLKAQKHNAKKVSFEVDNRTLPPVHLPQKKKKPLVRRGSWPPTNIPGQRYKKKKHHKYMKAIKNMMNLSLETLQDRFALMDSYEWLALNNEPEPSMLAPLASIEETPVEERPISLCDPLFDSFKPCIVPYLKSKSDKVVNTRCQPLTNSYQNDSNTQLVLCDGSNFAAQELARISGLREKIRLCNIRRQPLAHVLNSYGDENFIDDIEYENIYNQSEIIPTLPRHSMRNSHFQSTSVSIAPTKPKSIMNENWIPVNSIKLYTNKPKGILKSQQPLFHGPKQSLNLFEKSQHQQLAKSVPNTIPNEKQQSKKEQPLEGNSVPKRSNSSKSTSKSTSSPDSGISSTSSMPQNIETSAPTSSSDILQGHSVKATDKVAIAMEEKIKKYKKQKADKVLAASDTDSTKASAVGEAFLKSLMQQATETTQSGTAIPASVVGQAFLKTLQQQQQSEVEALEKPLPASVVGQAFLKLLMEQQQPSGTTNQEISTAQSTDTSDKKTISSSVIGQVFLKSLVEQTTEPNPSDLPIPSTVVDQTSLKSLLEHQEIESASKDKLIPASVVGQAFVKSLIEHELTEGVSKPIPATVIGQAFIKSILGLPEGLEEEQHDAPEEKTIPATVVGQAFLKSLIGQESVEFNPKEKPVPSTVIGQSFLKSLVQQTADISSETKPIPSAVVGQAFLKSLLEQPCEEVGSEEPIVPATVVGQAFLKSLIQESEQEVSKEKPIPATVVGQAFLKSLVHDTEQEVSQGKKIPSTVVGQAFLKSLVQESEQAGSKEKLIPATVLGQAFLKSLVQETDPLTSQEKAIPANVVGQTFLKSLVQESAQNIPEEKPIPATVVGQAFLKSLVQESVESTSQEKPVPANVVSLAFLKSLIQESEQCSPQEKSIPATVVGQSFLKSLLEQQTGVKESPIPSTVVGQAFLKSLAEQPTVMESPGEKVLSAGENSSQSHLELQSCDDKLSFPKSEQHQKLSGDDEQPVPASVIGQSFLKFLLQEPAIEEQNKKPIPAPVISQTFLRSFIGQFPEDKSSIIPEESYASGSKPKPPPPQPEDQDGEKVIPSSVVGQAFLKFLSEKSNESQTRMPSELVHEQALPKGVLEQPTSFSEKSIPASIISQAFMKTLLEQSQTSGQEQIQKSKDEPVPAYVVGQAFLKTLMEQQKSIVTTHAEDVELPSHTQVKSEKPIPADVVGHMFLKTMSEISTPSGRTDSSIPAAVIGQSFLKSLAELQEFSEDESTEQHISEPSVEQPCKNSSGVDISTNTETLGSSNTESVSFEQPCFSNNDAFYSTKYECNRSPKNCSVLTVKDPYHSENREPGNVCLNNKALEVKDELFILRNIWEDLSSLVNFHMGGQAFSRTQSHYLPSQFHVHHQLDSRPLRLPFHDVSQSTDSSTQTSINEKLSVLPVYNVNEINEFQNRLKNSTERVLEGKTFKQETNVATSAYHSEVNPMRTTLIHQQSNFPQSVCLQSPHSTDNKNKLWEKIVTVWNVAEEMRQSILTLYGMYQGNANSKEIPPNLLNVRFVSDAQEICINSPPIYASPFYDKSVLISPDTTNVDMQNFTGPICSPAKEERQYSNFESGRFLPPFSCPKCHHQEYDVPSPEISSPDVGDSDFPSNLQTVDVVSTMTSPYQASQFDGICKLNVSEALNSNLLINDSLNKAKTQNFTHFQETELPHSSKYTSSIDPQKSVQSSAATNENILYSSAQHLILKDSINSLKSSLNSESDTAFAGKLKNLCGEVTSILKQLSTQLVSDSECEYKESHLPQQSIPDSCHVIGNGISQYLTINYGQPNSNDKSSYSCTPTQAKNILTEPNLLANDENTLKHPLNEILKAPDSFSDSYSMYSSSILSKAKYDILPSYEVPMDLQNRTERKLEMSNSETGAKPKRMYFTRMKSESFEALEMIYPPPVQFSSSEDTSSQKFSVNRFGQQNECPDNNVAVAVIKELLLFTELMENVIGSMGEAKDA